jgi:putative phosphoribosyl transferase
MAIDFKNRAEAGGQLARLLIQYPRQGSVILVPMNGSIIIGKVVSNKLGIPMDFLLASPLHHPERWDEMIGAVSPAGFCPAGTGHDHPDYVEQMLPRIRKWLNERALYLRNGAPPQSLTDKTVIVITEGIRTGLKLFLSLNAVSIERPAKLAIAAPVIAPEAIPLITTVTPEIHSLFTPMPYYRTDSFYRQFKFHNDEELAAIFGGSQPLD